MINDLLDRIEDLVQDNTLLLVALNEKDEELQLAKEDEAALAQSGVELTAHNTQLQGQVHTLESDNKQLKIDHKGMTELYNDAHANGDALFAKSQSLERELDSANAQANALHVKNTSMQLQLDALQSNLGDYISRNESFKRVLASTQAQLDALRKVFGTQNVDAVLVAARGNHE